jgi:hypothetical protein
MLWAILRISSSSNGGMHLSWLNIRSAAKIASSPNPRRRMLPAMLARVLFRRPSGISPSTGPAPSRSGLASLSELPSDPFSVFTLTWATASSISRVTTDAGSNRIGRHPGKCAPAMCERRCG